MNAALTEAILVGLARRLDIGTVPEASAVNGAVASLLGSDQLEAVISRATADEESVRTRLALSTQAFAGI